MASALFAALLAAAQMLSPDPALQLEQSQSQIQQQAQQTQLNALQLQSQMNQDQVRRDQLFSQQRPLFSPTPFPAARPGATPLH